MELVCKLCRHPFVKAVRRQGLPDRVLSLFYAYPFRCQVCGHRFHLIQWGLRYVEQTVDRRQYNRRPVRVHARITSGQGDHEGTVADLAMGGCALETPAPLPEGTLLGLHLDAFDHEPAIVVDAAIVRSAKGSRLGLEFLRLGPGQEKRLSDYILTLWIQGTQEARRGEWRA